MQVPRTGGSAMEKELERAGQLPMGNPFKTSGRCEIGAAPL